MLTDRLPAHLHAAAARGVDALMLIVCGFVLWYGTRLSLETMSQSIAELPWLPVGVTYASIPLGAAATMLFVLERLFYGPQTRRGVVAFGEAH